MTTGILNQTFKFSLHGVAMPSATLEVPALQLTAKLEPAESALQLKVCVRGVAEHEADGRAINLSQILYHRFLLKFGRDIDWSEPPRTITRTYTTDSSSPVRTVSQNIGAKAFIVRPIVVLPQSEISDVARDVERRVIMKQPGTSTQLDTAIAMYAFGLESQNKIVRFLVLYSALALIADGKQENIDELIRQANPTITLLPSPRKNCVETVYTKLRNELIHSEDRGREPEKAIGGIKEYIGSFQQVVSLIFSKMK